MKIKILFFGILALVLIGQTGFVFGAGCGSQLIYECQGSKIMVCSEGGWVFYTDCALTNQICSNGDCISQVESGAIISGLQDSDFLDFGLSFMDIAAGEIWGTEEGIEYNKIGEDRNRFSITGANASLNIKDNPFENILSQGQAGHPSYIETDNFGNITKVDFTVNEEGGTYLINGINFEVPGNSRVKYNVETGFEFPEGTQIKNIKGMVLNKETGRIAPTAFYGEIFFSGKDINFFDEFLVNGEGSISKQGFSFIGEANYKGMRISGEDNILIVTEPLTDLSDYNGNWIKQTPTTLDLQSAEGSSMNVRFLERNEVLNNDKYSKLNLNVEGGDGLEITKTYGATEILHKSSENGITNIQNGELGLILNKNNMLVEKPGITVDDILSENYKSVQCSIVSNSQEDSLSVDLNGKGIHKTASGTNTYQTSFSKEVLEKVNHEELTEIAQTLKDNAGGRANGFLNDDLPKTLTAASQAGFTKDQSLHLFKKTIEFAGEDSSMIFADLNGEGYDEGLLDKIKIKENSDKILDSLLKTVESASNAGVPQNLDYSNKIFLEALDKNFDLDLTTDYIDEAFKLNQDVDGFSILNSDFLVGGLNEYNGENFGEIKQGISLLKKYDISGYFANNFDLSYTSITNEETFSKEYVRAVDKNVKGGIDPSKSIQAADFINRIHNKENKLFGTDKMRQAIAKELSDESKYYLIAHTYGVEDALYTSTFGALYKNFPEDIFDKINEIDPDGKDSAAFALQLGSQGLLVEGDSKFVVENIKKSLSVEDEDTLSKNAPLVVETIKEYYDNPKYNDEEIILKEFLESEYEEGMTNTKKGIFDFLLDPQGNLKEIPKKWTEKSVIAGKLYFYDDEDWFGITRNEYDNEYKMDLITSTNNKAILTRRINDKTILIELELVPHTLKANSLEAIAGDVYILIAHRGHSYRLKKTFHTPNCAEKIIYLGSCSSFAKTPEMLLLYPNAHIIGRQKMADGKINNEVIYGILEGLAEGKTNWNELIPPLYILEGVISPTNPATELASKIADLVSFC